jgi:hypothetical protein
VQVKAAVVDRAATAALAVGSCLFTVDRTASTPHDLAPVVHTTTLFAPGQSGGNWHWGVAPVEATSLKK